ncbi:BLOC-3 complex member HPS1-like [Glandiceps talaboti]
MKCVVVIMNLSMPDIVYIAADKQFTAHINNVAVENGLLQPEDITDEVDINAATQFFSPFVASQGMLTNELDNPYSAITCENGFMFVFREFGEHLYIGINGDGEEDEEFLRRKLLLLQRIIGFLYGPIVQKIKPDNYQERYKIWSKISSLINTWVKLYKEEQGFLLEAIERLHVSQSLSELCIHVLEGSLNKMKDSGERFPIHALLTVNSKLLALYSSRKSSELQSSDLLMMILMVQNLYPTTKTLQDLMAASPKLPHRPNSPEEGAVAQPDEHSSVQGEMSVDDEMDQIETEQEIDSLLEERGDQDCKGSSEEFHSPMSTPERGRSPVFDPPETSTPMVARIHGKPEMEEGAAKQHGSVATPVPVQGEAKNSMKSSYDQYHTPQEVLPSRSYISRLREKISKTASTGLGRANDEEDIFVEAFSTDAREVSTDHSSFHVIESPHFTEDITVYMETHRFPVFLRTPASMYAPHEIHILQVLPETVLVMITEVKSSMASLITRSLASLEAILKMTNSKSRRSSGAVNGKVIIDTLESNVKKISEIAKKFNGKGLIQYANRDLPIKWDSLKKAGFLDYLESGMVVPMSPRLETCLSELMKYLKYIFGMRFLMPKHRTHQAIQKYQEAIAKIEQLSKAKLRDYKEYLSVKGQRNVTMTAYMEDFPGLVHFTYVDRMVDILTAPSINSEAAKDDRDPSQLLKNKIWELAKTSQKYLQRGFTSLLRRDGDYYYSYFIWFEDPMGNPLPMQHPPKVDPDGPPPGILSGHFYRKMVRQCFPNAPVGSVHCYELMCMHVGVVPVQYVVNHCQNLAAKLWETSGELNSPISLL